MNQILDEFPGLHTRNGVYYLQKKHQQIDRPHSKFDKSLQTKDLSTAIDSYKAVMALVEAGDWTTVHRWLEGTVHLDDIRYAHRKMDRTVLQPSLDDPILGEWAERFLEAVQGYGTTSTHHQYKHYVNLFVEDVGPDRDMRKVTVEGDCHPFLRKPREGHMAAEKDKPAPWVVGTQEVAVRVLRRLWNWVEGVRAEEARANGIPTPDWDNPWTRVKLGRGSPPRDALSRKRALACIEEARGTPACALVACGFLAGLRNTEIRMLQIGVDVKLDESPAKLEIRDRRPKNGWKGTRTKTENSWRTLRMDPLLEEIIREHIMFGFHGKEGHLFVSGASNYPSDRPISLHTACRWTKEAYERVGIPYGYPDDFTLHNARHSFVTWLLEDGVPVKTVAKMAGDHWQTIMNVYAHVTEGSMDDAWKVFRERLEEARGTADGTTLKALK